MMIQSPSPTVLRTARHVRARIRFGISLLEVIFATGVLLIGLLGLAAVLPIASNNALRSINNDRAKEAYLNQANLRSVLGLDDLAQMDSYFTAENSKSKFVSETQAYKQYKKLYIQWQNDYEAWLENQDPNKGPAPPAPPPQPRPERFPIRNASTVGDLPDAFCIDPWFLTAANTIRDDAPTTVDGTGIQLNYYDRTVFPCYDDYYPIDISPSAEISVPRPQAAWSFGADSLRRMPRVGISSITSAGFHETSARDRDTIALILNPEDKSMFPGLALLRTPPVDPDPNNPDTLLRRRVSSTLDGRYSYLMTVRSNGTGNVVVFRDRQIVIDPTTRDYNSKHNLAPYEALPFASGNIPLNQRTFSDERVGYVTYVDRIFRGNGGSFTFDVSAFVDPSVNVGDWIMLMRRDFSPPVPGDPLPVPGDLKFTWCRIASVDEGPTLSGSTYRTKITVRDVNWLFHPIQDFHQFLGSGPYPGGQSGAGNPNGWNGRVYDYSVVGKNRDNPGNTGTAGDPLYGTQVVLMKNIVSVQSF